MRSLSPYLIETGSIRRRALWIDSSSSEEGFGDRRFYQVDEEAHAELSTPVITMDMTLYCSPGLVYTSAAFRL